MEATARRGLMALDVWTSCAGRAAREILFGKSGKSLVAVILNKHHSMNPSTTVYSQWLTCCGYPSRCQGGKAFDDGNLAEDVASSDDLVAAS